MKLELLWSNGNYQFPVLTYLKEQGLLVAVINSLIMKKYASTVIKKGKMIN